MKKEKSLQGARKALISCIKAPHALHETHDMQVFRHFLFFHSFMNHMYFLKYLGQGNKRGSSSLLKQAGHAA
jgi:hypothetical protein